LSELQEPLRWAERAPLRQDSVHCLPQSNPLQNKQDLQAVQVSFVHWLSQPAKRQQVPYLRAAVATNQEAVKWRPLEPLRARCCPEAQPAEFEDKNESAEEDCMDGYDHLDSGNGQQWM